MKKIIILLFFTFTFVQLTIALKNNDTQKFSDNKLKRIYFGYWKPTMVNPKSLKENINILKEELSKNPNLKLVLVGHAGHDFKKPQDYKQKLIDMSLVRAKAVEKELIENGIPKNRILKVTGIGYKDAAILPSKTLTLKQLNNIKEELIKSGIPKEKLEQAIKLNYETSKKFPSRSFKDENIYSQINQKDRFVQIYLI